MTASLQTRVRARREVIVARAPSIPRHARRLYWKLGHPAKLIPAFAGGMVIGALFPIRRQRRPGQVAPPLKRFYPLLGLLDTLGRLTVLLGTVGRIRDQKN
jgi:hypothetical protein